MGDDPHCSLAAAEPESVLSGKASFGEVKRLKFFILKMENNPPHNPVPLPPFQPDHQSPLPKNQE